MRNTETENTADAVRYAIRFDRNGGTGTAPRTMEADAGGNIALPGSGPDMVKANGVFAGRLVADGWLFADDKTFRPNAGTDGFIPTGTYRLELHLADDRWETLGIYRIASKILAAGINFIQFSDFRKAGLQGIAD